MADLDVYQPPSTALDPGTAEGVSWFEATLRQAEYLASSEIVPEQYRGRPADIVVAAMYGRDMGWSPTMAMTHIHVVKGKPSLSSQSMVALVRGAGHSITGEKSSEKAVAVGTRVDTGDTMSETFTMDDARQAGLAGSSTWKSYPAAMLWARAVSALCRSLFPDVLMGLSYTPEELEGLPETSPAEPARSEDQLERDRLVDQLKALHDKLGPELEPDWMAWRNRQDDDWHHSPALIREAIDHVTGVLAKAGHEPFDVESSEVAVAQPPADNGEPAAGVREDDTTAQVDATRSDAPPDDDGVRVVSGSDPAQGSEPTNAAIPDGSWTIDRVKAWANANGIGLPAAAGWKKADWIGWGAQKASGQ